jgi:hypothetical protein
LVTSFDRLEEVDLEAGQIVDAGELGIDGAEGVAIIADEGADDGAVFCWTWALSFFW